MPLKSGDHQGCWRRCSRPFATVDEALRLIENENISAAILDMQLWEDTSLSIARRLADKNIPFLFYTAHSDKINLWVAGEIVKKPATSVTLVSALARVISNFTQPTPSYGAHLRQVPCLRDKSWAWKVSNSVSPGQSQKIASPLCVARRSKRGAAHP